LNRQVAKDAKFNTECFSVQAQSEKRAEIIPPKMYG
jgi:hypothetical protein